MCKQLNMGKSAEREAKNRTPSICLATTAHVYVQMCIRVTTFSNGSIILTSFKFTELHALTLATCSYALLIWVIWCGRVGRERDV